MAQVNVSIAGRTYRMACDDGEEAHLERLAQRFDTKIAELRDHFGEIGDGRITVMAALTIADDLSAAETRIAVLEERIIALADEARAGEGRLEMTYAAFAESLAEAAQRVERLARGLDAMRPG